jgi:hypothetical protein
MARNMPLHRIELLGALTVLVLVSGCDNGAPSKPLQRSGATDEGRRPQVSYPGPTPKGILQRASFFVNGDRNPTLLAAIRDGMDDRVTFNGRYSNAYVSCGPGCDSHWFVDRQTGGIIEAPVSAVDEEMIWEIAAEPDNDVIKVTFGPRDGIDRNCSAQRFRLSGRAFVAIDQRAPRNCPS